MPDWAMITLAMLKGGLWFTIPYHGLIGLAGLLRWAGGDDESIGVQWSLGVAILAGIGLAAIEGWMTP